MSIDPEQPGEVQKAVVGEPRWPMALAVIATGLLRATLPPQLRNGDAAWVLTSSSWCSWWRSSSATPAASTGTARGSTT